MNAAPVTDKPFFVCDVEEVAVREAPLGNVGVEWPSVKVLKVSKYCANRSQYVELGRTASKWMIDTGP